MQKFKVAHLREQGQDMIIVFVHAKVGGWTDEKRQQLSAQLQICADNAGLAGSVVLIWQTPLGHSEFSAPKPWHPFLKSISYQMLAGNINKELTCNNL